MKELYQALGEAQKSVTALKKSGRGQRSKYLACDDAIAASREAFLGAGILPAIVEARLEELATDPDDNGELRRQLVLVRTLRLVHLETGQALDIKQRWPVVVDRRMPLDHATAAADSFGLTYLFRGLLLFERGDEDDRRTHGKPQSDKKSDHNGNEKPAKKPVTKKKVDRIVTTAAEKLGATKAHLEKFTPHIASSLKKAGWAGKVAAEELEAAFEDDFIPRQMLRDLYADGRKAIGAEETKTLFNSLGVVPGETNAVSGRKAFDIAMAITGA